MRVSVVLFPGSNCEHDVVHVYGTLLNAQVEVVWYADEDLKKPDLVVLPGGFAYGDYLRTGALAKIAPIMPAVKQFAEKGGPVLGICNGFQILCEVGLLPGTLLRNKQLKFLSQFVHLKVENDQTPMTRGVKPGTIVTCPIAHGEGNYFAFPDTIRELESEGQVVFRYVDSKGKVANDDLDINPNGAINSIAGICNKKRNVVGLMPHPERSAEQGIGHIGTTHRLTAF